MINDGKASAQADIFSLGCVLYYLLNIDKGDKAYALTMADQFSTMQYTKACQDLKRNMDLKFSAFPYHLKTLFTTSLDLDPSNRGNVSSLVDNSFFQDPLIKTIRYLENIEHKEHHNVVQFLTGLSRILDKFDKRSCIRKILPLMLR